MTTRQIRNDRSNAIINTSLSNQEAADVFAKNAPDGNWLWFWIHKAAMEYRAAESTQSGATAPGGGASKAIAFLGDSFMVALGYGLLSPMVRVHYKGKRFKIYLSDLGTLCIKSGPLVQKPDGTWTKDPTTKEQYVGKLIRGRFEQGRRGYYGQPWNEQPLRPMDETETEFVEKLSDKPVTFLAQLSKDMSRCCYCYMPLETAESKKRGYGPDCAKRWGLPWSQKKAKAGMKCEKVPSFAQAWSDSLADEQRSAHSLLVAVRNDPKNEMLWEIFADWLELAGLPRCSMPKKAVTLPRSDS